MTIKGIAAGICACGLLSAGAPVAAAQLSKSDQAFVRMAADANMTEAHEGQMAEDRAASQGVKDFAQKLIQDHSNAYGKLLDLAQKNGESIPRGIDARRNPEIAQLSKLKGNAFDSRFIQDEVRDHEKTIAAFRNEAEHGQNADLKSYANEELSTLRDHLKIAQQLEKGSKGKS